MADTVDSVVLHNGTRKYVVRLYNSSDGTGESAVKKVDLSTLTGPDGVNAPTKVAIEEVSYDIQGFASVTLLFDHTTDDEALILSGNGYMDLRPYGGLIDPSSAGGTGDVLLTTNSATATSSYSIVLSLRLMYA